jgi:type IV pilus assembly protein PilQ
MKNSKKVYMFIGSILMLATNSQGASSQTVPTQSPIVSPRAVPAPIGDISVSGLDATTPEFVLDSTAKVSLVLNNASAKAALQSLAKTAKLNIAYYDELASDKLQIESKVSISLENEPIQSAFNYILRLGKLEASKIGNTIFVGAKLPDTLRSTVVKSMRLNQTSSAAAANYLATQGAESQIASTKIEYQTVGEGANARTSENRTPQLSVLKPAEGSGTLLLRGLSVSTDERLNSITLVGSAHKVKMAEAMLTRLDARRRQVALNVKIVDVNLSNTDIMSNSLSFKAGEGFLSVDKGAAVYNYGGFNPATNKQTLDSPTTPPLAPLNVPGTNQPFLDYSPDASKSAQTSSQPGGVFGNIPRPGLGSTQFPYQPGISNVDEKGIVTYTSPTTYQIPTKFLSTLQAQIVSGTGKILTDPTLVVQEGQKSTVNLTQDVFGGFEVNTVSSTGSSSTTKKPIINKAGLTLDILVNRIDDNGYVSVGVSPTVSSIGSTVTTSDGDINLLQSRTMNSGEIRLRDGQTLILSGIIQQTDRSSVSKVPILGDLPILGALFRSTNKTNQRQEVVVLLTPQILSDTSGQINYTPGVDARMMIGK